MRARHPSRLALALLDFFVADNEPLKGDLVEEFESRQSQMWLWRQILGAIIWQSTLRSLRPRHGMSAVILSVAVLLLVSFETVLVTNLLHRLTFGPPLPNISGHLYLSRELATPAPAASAGPWALAMLVALVLSLPIGWRLGRLHESHQSMALWLFGVTVVLCSVLNLAAPLPAQFVAIIVFVGGLLAGGRLAEPRAA